jgi:hypothetical protein
VQLTDQERQVFTVGQSVYYESTIGGSQVRAEEPRPVRRERIQYRYNSDEFLIEKTTFFEELVVKLAFNYSFYDPDVHRLAGNVLQGGRLQGSIPFLATAGGIKEFWTRDNCGRWVKVVERMEITPEFSDGQFLGRFTPGIKPGVFDDEPPESPTLKPLPYSLEEEQIKADCKVTASASPSFEREKQVNFGYVASQAILERLACLRSAVLPN